MSALKMAKLGNDGDEKNEKAYDWLGWRRVQDGRGSG